MATAREMVRLDDVTIRFRFSYDKARTARERLGQLKKRFTGGWKPRYFTAVDHVNLTIREGDVVGVVGPNGSGKTTLLKTICGIYSPNRGEVTTSGRVSTLLSLGTGFDNTMNGIDNIRLNGLIMGMSADEIEKKIPMIIDFADIGDHIHAPMKYYSSGMISRVSFATVLAMRPEVLLVDEVFSVGDLDFQSKSKKAMKDLLDQASCQVIVSHSLALIREHCNRAIYVRGGRILADGDPDEVISRYEADSPGYEPDDDEGSSATGTPTADELSAEEDGA